MLLSHPHLRRDFDRFLLDLGTYGPPKNIKKLMVFNDFCNFCMFVLETDFGSILGRFWAPKSS